MQTDERDIELLFAFVDQAIEEAPGLARTALEGIIARQPGNARAVHLIDVIESSYVPPDPVRSIMEAAEGLAAQGLHLQAREVVSYMRRRYASHAEARAWLEGVNLILES